jgi:hypothetical protein
MAKANVSVLLRGAEEEVEYEDVTDITYINGESHGKGPVGSFDASTRRLILHSGDAIATFIEGKA